MRIWSLHPQYLDAKGLVALWREALLAKKVLEGKTRGYKHHPQLDRFRQEQDPVGCVDQYLTTVYEQAVKRGYHFDRNKINYGFVPITMSVTRGQIKYETGHLLNKLKVRDKEKYSLLKANKDIQSHPLFRIVEGKIERWEIKE